MTETPAAAPAAPTSAPTPGNASDTPPPRRGRGRPFGSMTRKPPLVEQAVPATAADGVAPASQDVPAPRRRRSKSIDKEAVAKQLVDLHAMLARFTGVGLLQIEMREGATLADAIENVAREYDLEFSGKTGALMQLLFAAGVVYGPRVMLYQAMKKRAAQGEAGAVSSPPETSPLNGARAAS
jgi:hypothetical protein